MATYYKKVSDIGINLSDDTALAAVTLKDNITDPDNDVDVSDGDLLVRMDDNGARIGSQYHEPPAAPTAQENYDAHRPLFNAERDRLFAATDWARTRHTDRLAQSIDDTANWALWQTYWQTMRDLPDTQTDFTTNLQKADSEFDLATDVDWPTQPA